jgi:hypothetical protein
MEEMYYDQAGQDESSILLVETYRRALIWCITQRNN